MAEWGFFYYGAVPWFLASLIFVRLWGGGEGRGSAFCAAFEEAMMIVCCARQYHHHTGIAFLSLSLSRIWETTRARSIMMKEGGGHLRILHIHTYTYTQLLSS